MTKFSDTTNLLSKGHDISDFDQIPESIPLYLTSAFNMGNLSDVERVYSEKGYTYIRTRNPTRRALAEAVSFLEQGEETLIFSSGMGAIFTTLFTLIHKGDHILANRNIYGETFDVITNLLPKIGAEIEYVDFGDLDAVKQAVKGNTALLYSEVVSNPTDHLADVAELAAIAHGCGALLMIDNTFTTGISVKPLVLGADIVINSLTKFMNGHSDALAGSITSTSEIIEEIHTVRMLVGTTGSTLDSWLVYRGLKTLDLRIKKQMKNACRLAKFLDSHPAVLWVNHPCLNSHSQRELAKKLFRSDEEMTGMLSFAMPDEDKTKIDRFMDKIQLVRYAPTLGGVRSTFSHPAHSSHHHMSEEERQALGIPYGLMRVSVGIEDAEDLIADFAEALKVFEK